MDQQIKGKLTAEPPTAKEEPVMHILPVPNPPVQPRQPATVITIHHPSTAAPPEVQPVPQAPPKVDEKPRELRPKVKEARPPTTQEHLVPTRRTGLAALLHPRPHPLLWICLSLSILALVLGVPKGYFPTVTGRHKALREQEALVAQQANLLLSLSTLLPPPLASIINRNTPRTSVQPAQLALDNWRFWTASAVNPDSGLWWSIEDLGEGASVVRSRNTDQGREVWVVKEGSEPGHTDKSLVNALSHSLLLRDQLLKELADLRRDVVLLSPGRALPPSRVEENRGEAEWIQGQRELEAQQVQIESEWKRFKENQMRAKERERAVIERESEVAQRERWVLDEMKRLSDQVHAQATELSLEDRITERLKAYQRQLAHAYEHKD